MQNLALTAAARHWFGTRLLLNLALTNKEFYGALGDELKRHKYLYKKYNKTFAQRFWARIIEHPFYKTKTPWCVYMPYNPADMETIKINAPLDQKDAPWRFVSSIGIIMADRVPFTYGLLLGGRPVVCFYFRDDEYVECVAKDGTSAVHYYAQLDLRLAVNSLPLLEDPYIGLVISDTHPEESGYLPLVPDPEFTEEFVRGVLVAGDREIPADTGNNYSIGTMTKLNSSYIRIAE